MTPWYKQRWPWILMSGPAAAIVAGLATAWVAFAGADGLVADDYYKRGLAVNAVLEREQAAARRGIAAEATLHGNVLRVVLRGDSPPALVARLVHATRAGEDVRLQLAPAGGGAYEAGVPPLAPGARRLVLEDPRAEWRIVQERL